MGLCLFRVVLGLFGLIKGIISIQMSDKIRLKLNEMEMKWDKTDKLRKRQRKIDYCQVYPAINLNYSSIQYEKHIIDQILT